MEQLIKEIRAIPLLERIEMAKRMIGAMCAEGRCPKMSVPVRAMDEDVFITQTLTDLEEYYKQSSFVISH